MTPIRRRITQPVFDNAISLLVPFAAYVPAELIKVADFHGSGIIAVVAGLVLGHKSPVIQSGQSRLSERVNWATISFLLENTVFLLIGLQARRIVSQVSGSTLSGGRDRRLRAGHPGRGHRDPARLGLVWPGSSCSATRVIGRPRARPGGRRW